MRGACGSGGGALKGSSVALSRLEVTGAARGLACAHPGDRVERAPVGGARRFNQRWALVMQSDRKSRLIAICMLAGAVVMIGLALTGTLQMRVSRSSVTQVVTIVTK